MSNIEITNIDNGSVELRDAECRDELLVFAGVATILAGTILARKLVSDTVAVAYTRAGSSDYTAVASQDSGRTLELGDYVVTAGTLTAGVGEWTAVAPGGATESFTSSAAGDDLLFPALGLTLTVTVVAAAFETGDVITATAAAETDLPLVPFVKTTGTGGAAIPKAVLQYEHTSAGAGNEPIRPIVSGVINATRLVINADGDASNVDNAVLDQLRDCGIVALDVKQLAHVDNPQP